MRSVSRRALAVGLPLGIAGCAGMPWPEAQPNARPGRSRSKHQAQIPQGVRIVPPAPDVPEPLRFASGSWEGWAGGNAQSSIAIAIREVGRDGGHGVYVYADDFTPPRVWDWTFSLVNGNEMRGRVGFGSVTLRARPDGHMDFLFLPFSGVWSSGVLSRSRDGTRRRSWPDFQATLRPAESRSTNAAVLPAAARIVPPSDGIPAPLRAASGRWRGWAGRNWAFSIAVAVQEVGTSGGTGTYAFASSTSPSDTWPWVFQLVDGNELSGLAGEAILTLRQRRDGSMDFMSERDDSWIVGVLTQEA